MKFNNQEQFYRYAYACMSEIDKFLRNAGFGDDDIIDVIESIEQKVAQSIRQKSPDFDRENVHFDFDDGFLCIDNCSFDAETGTYEPNPTEMIWPDMSNVDKALADIGLGLEIDWDIGVDYTEDLDDCGRYTSYTGDIKAILQPVDMSKFMKFVKSLKGVVDEDMSVDMSKDRAEDDSDEEKKYTKKQIIEAVKYWQKQLELGNYKQVNERAAEGINRTGDPMFHVDNDGSPVEVTQLLEAFDVLYPGQEDSPINAGVNGENYGQVNQVLDEDGKCVLTLAPYKNGRQSKDLSIGFSGPAMRMQKFMQALKSIPDSFEVVVKMKDPYGFGPAAGRVIERNVVAIDVDSAYGIFLRLDDK